MRHSPNKVIGFGVGVGESISLPVIIAGCGIRESVLGPRGACSDGASGLWRSGGVDRGKQPSDKLSSPEAWLCEADSDDDGDSINNSRSCRF